MPVAHYKIDSSLLELRTCSIFACQWGLWRGEMRLKLLLIDVVDSSALFALRCLRQASEHSSDTQGNFCRKVQHTYFCPPAFPMRSLFPAQRKVISSGAELCPQSHRGGSIGTKGHLHSSPSCVYTVRPFALVWTGLADNPVQEIPEIFASGHQQKQSLEATHMKNWEGAKLMRSV